MLTSFPHLISASCSVVELEDWAPDGCTAARLEAAAAAAAVVPAVGSAAASELAKSRNLYLVIQIMHKITIMIIIIIHKIVIKVVIKYVDMKIDIIYYFVY